MYKGQCDASPVNTSMVGSSVAWARPGGQCLELRSRLVLSGAIRARCGVLCRTRDGLLCAVAAHCFRPSLVTAS